jgi:hypothetical protein
LDTILKTQRFADFNQPVGVDPAHAEPAMRSSRECAVSGSFSKERQTSSELADGHFYGRATLAMRFGARNDVLLLARSVGHASPKFRVSNCTMRAVAG